MFSKIFIERPRLAAVISIVIFLAGSIALFNIPVAQYPQITPPEITVSATYPGANAQVVCDTVASPIEEEVNGVENMLYMSSTCSNEGRYQLSVTFAVGSDPDIDQVNLQNRIQLAESKLPQEVVDQGISVRRRTANIMAAISFYSPRKSRDKLFLSNYVSTYVEDALLRVPGVSDVMIFGEKEYSMRIWLNPDRLTALGLTPSDVITAIRNQNIQAAVGSIGTAPAPQGQQIQLTLKSRGRLEKPEEFENIVVRTNELGGVVRVRDVGRVELASLSYSHESTLNGAPVVTIAVYRSSDANTLETMEAVRNELKRLSADFPEDIDYSVVLDTTEYVSAAIKEIRFTLGLTFLLVLIVNFVFLQDWRATLIPTVVIPVSIIGTFAILLLIGYSANTISLFGLVMAIGLVVDDSIVVVENVMRIMSEEKLPPKEATLRSMEQITGPVIATTLVLLAVFVPVAFVPGITGQLYRQFAVTISISVCISTLCALTLSPAMCASILVPVGESSKKKSGFQRILDLPFRVFNTSLDRARKGYVGISGWLIRKTAISLLIYGLIIFFTWMLFTSRPRSFIPDEDQGYFFINVQLPEAASLERTVKTMEKVTALVRSIPGVRDVIGVSGFSILSGGAENVAFGIAILKPWDERKGREMHIDSIVAAAQRKVATLPEATCFVFTPPPIMGLGRSGGFDFRLLALEGQSPQEMQSVAMALMIAANQHPALQRVFTTYRADTPQLFVTVDRTKAEFLNVPVSPIFSTLQAYMGSAYVNDFTLRGRTYQVRVQAEERYRNDLSDVYRLYVRSDAGQMIPLRSLIKVSTITGPQIISRYNQFPSVSFQGSAAPGYSSGQAMDAMEELARKVLPRGYGFEWSSISYQEKQVRGQVLVIFLLAMVFGYLFLVGQYESWNMPIAIILYVPISTFGALLGLWVAGLPLSLYAQIGLVLLVGLSSKNAILIVEFAKNAREEGKSTTEAALEAARIRFRPVLMTAFTFIFGVIPMVVATGAGAASRRAIGTTVFSGMLVCTIIGIFFIPMLFYCFQTIREKAHSLLRPGEKPVDGAIG
ncbi:efflux RND transporter permease subunit [Thermodesulforhabdus norvegica]|uniref:Hydrophobic/amphiphilic exporter-1, HAE1 family n=1 Tax=Thermodesulforhabdus norvegica TaxID=39841 RepID=A0A1I4QGR5_9BACT|nr:multidrug efflux RND transporter permease subunit [Thermodesulforhabdus norvegica]SFM39207.1 hydrophobic/amphiphilic exporter-1, HAE1 family [Thermodesulforhabdus norvegica]